MKKLILGFKLLIIFMFFIGCSGSSSDSISTTDLISDSSLRSAIESQLGTTITLDNLATIQSLNVFGSGVVSDLSGIHHLTQLQSLSISVTMEAARDLDKLATSLEVLNIDLRNPNGSVQDTSSLGLLTNVKELSLSSNFIDNVLFLENLTNLTRLQIYSTSLSNFNVLNQLTKLVYLRLRAPNLTSIGFLNSPQLRSLEITGANLGSLNGIETSNNIVHLNLPNNNISDISSLSSLSSLNRLNLRNNRVRDISSLVNLPIKTLDLKENFISTLPSDMANMSVLSRLDLSDNYIYDITNLSNIITLKYLNLSLNSVTNLSASGLTSLEELDISFCALNTIPGLTNFPSLFRLNLSNNNLITIDNIATMISLEDLNISHNDIQSISALSNLLSLKMLSIENNNIADLSVLQSLNALTALYNFDNPLDSNSQSVIIPALKDRGVTVFSN